MPTSYSNYDKMMGTNGLMDKWVNLGQHFTKDVFQKEP